MAAWFRWWRLEAFVAILTQLDEAASCVAGLRRLRPASTAS
jgi:hypothetical protein